MPKGVIYVVATPVGNLEDITLRALRTLREVDFIACEDTRHTGRLLRHFEIEKPLISCHEHNEARRAHDVVARALNGESAALVSDAGTPAISDPGYRVVRAAWEAGVRVVPIPGPSALIAALAASGLATDEFLFKGFLPPRKAKRQAALMAMEGSESTIILYEAPHRILETLADLQAVLGDRSIVVARELTKLHEEFLRGTAQSIRQELFERAAVKGEFVVLVGPAEGEVSAPEESLETRVRQLESEGRGRMDAIKQAAQERGIAKRTAYAQLHTDKASD